MNTKVRIIIVITIILLAAGTISIVLTSKLYYESHKAYDHITYRIDSSMTTLHENPDKALQSLYYLREDVHDEQKRFSKVFILSTCGIILVMAGMTVFARLYIRNLKAN